MTSPAKIIPSISPFWLVKTVRRPLIGCFKKQTYPSIAPWYPHDIPMIWDQDISLQRCQVSLWAHRCSWRSSAVIFWRKNIDFGRWIHPDCLLGFNIDGKGSGWTIMLIVQQDPPSPMIYHFCGCDVNQQFTWVVYFCLPTSETNVVCWCFWWLMDYLFVDVCWCFCWITIFTNGWWTIVWLISGTSRWFRSELIDILEV